MTEYSPVPGVVRAEMTEYSPVPGVLQPEMTEYSRMPGVLRVETTEYSRVPGVLQPEMTKYSRLSSCESQGLSYIYRIGFNSQYSLHKTVFFCANLLSIFFICWYTVHMIRIYDYGLFFLSSPQYKRREKKGLQQ